MSKKYSIGLDIGVASVGWACLTPEFRIPKHNGRYAIGVREFEAANTAEERRIQRGTRRRYNRRIKRIQLLQQTLNPLFQNDSNFIMNIDANEQHFWRNNNQFENKSLSEVLTSLNINPKKYPTIFHLRKALLKSEQKFDPRLIYLALHNLVKYRGHFLNESMGWINTKENETTLEMLNEYFTLLEQVGYGNNQQDQPITENILLKIVQIIENKELTNSDKRTSIKKLIGKEYHDPISLIIGLKSNMNKLFFNSDNANSYKEEKLKISFTDEDITEVYEKLTDDEQVIIDQANKIFQHVLLNDLLDGHQCVAEAKVTSYDQFKEDLMILKDIYNQYLGEKAYRDMFITSRTNQTKYKNTKDIKFLCTFDRFLKVHKEEDAFYKELKKVFDSIIKSSDSTKDDITNVQNALERLNKNVFLQKQKSYLNAAIPHQNNEYEAKTILKNQQKYYPEITDDMINKVSQIISFRIPYYIGPLLKKATDNDFGWVVRKNTSEHALPWTIDEVIDRSQSAEKFINRMTNYCAYLTNEKVLPKHSLSYQLFEVLNELNGIQIRPEYELPNKKYRLDYEEKQWVIKNVFQKYKNVTHKILLRELKNSPYKELVLDNQTDNLNNVFGTQKEDRFGSSLSSYISLSNIFPNIDQSNEDMIEELIYWITVFEDKDIIKLKIKEKYSNISDKQIELLVQLPFVGWGRLSHKLINELPADINKSLTILDIMKQKPVVFMEVLGTEKYQLNERFKKLNLQNNHSFTKIRYKDIAELQGSPSIKKGIWQAILIIEDLVEIFGEPEHIMIEFAREEGAKKRTEDRKKQINNLQKAISKDEKELKSFLKEHSRYNEDEYNDQRLYLYITQEGKCLYTGEALNVSRLQDYEIDHILPKNFVKDDSFDNLALVTSEANQAKGGTKMPLEIISDKDKFYQKTQWKKLLDNKLISQSKYFKLMKESFSDQDKESFFARQLVETRQITKHVKDLLNDRFEHTEIHPVNANIVTNLRKHSNITKMRGLNNKHHAIDAAITALVVQFVINKYGSNFLNFNFKYQEAQKKWKEMMTKYKKNFFLFSDIDKYDKFIHFSTGELLSGREFLNALNNDIPWQTTKKIGSSESAFYKETLFSPKVKKAKYKSSKLNKGVHTNVHEDSSFLISYKYLNKSNKKIVVSRIVSFNVIEKHQLKNINQKKLAMFLAKKVAKGTVIDAIIHTKINKFQRIVYNNHDFYYITFDNDKNIGEMHNAKQLILNEKILKIITNVYNTSTIEYNYEDLKEVFIEIANIVIKDYSEFLTTPKINSLKQYHNNIVDIDSFKNAITELFTTTSAGPGRTKLFGSRYQKTFKLGDLLFIHESITGLHHRKPKSYKHELWSK